MTASLFNSSTKPPFVDQLFFFSGFLVLFVMVSAKVNAASSLHLYACGDHVVNRQRTNCFFRASFDAAFLTFGYFAQLGHRFLFFNCFYDCLNLRVLRFFETFSLYVLLPIFFLKMERHRVMDLLDIYLLNLVLTVAMFIVLIVRAWLEFKNYKVMWNEIEWQKTRRTAREILKSEKETFLKMDGGQELYDVLYHLFEVDDRKQ
jgi:hypothetical protein